MMFAATRAPTGSNRQGFRFVVLTDSPVAMKAKHLLGEVARAAWTDKRRSDQYDNGSGAQGDSPKARMAATMDHFVDHFDEVPCVVLACLERHRAPVVTEGASVYPAVQNLLLAARSLGYGGVITMWQAGVQNFATCSASLRKLRCTAPFPLAVQRVAVTVRCDDARWVRWCLATRGEYHRHGRLTHQEHSSRRLVRRQHQLGVRRDNVKLACQLDAVVGDGPHPNGRKNLYTQKICSLRRCQPSRTYAPRCACSCGAGYCDC
jgi:hypothetical protein